MTVESKVQVIDDTNYLAFRGNPRAVLVLAKSDCTYCEQYEPVVEALTEALPDVRFGRAVLDKGYLIGVKRAYPEIIAEGVPATVLISRGDDVVYFMGAESYRRAFDIIEGEFARVDPPHRPGFWHGLANRLIDWSRMFHGDSLIN